MAPEDLLHFVKLGSLITLLGNIGIVAVFGRRILDQFRGITRSAITPDNGPRTAMLVDTYTGKPIPLDEASNAAIVDAVSALKWRQQTLGPPR